MGMCICVNAVSVFYAGLAEPIETKPVQPVAQGHSVLNVVGQETCEYVSVTTSASLEIALVVSFLWESCPKHRFRLLLSLLVSYCAPTSISERPQS